MVGCWYKEAAAGSSRADFPFNWAVSEERKYDKKTKQQLLTGQMPCCSRVAALVLPICLCLFGCSSDVPEYPGDHYRQSPASAFQCRTQLGSHRYTGTSLLQSSKQRPVERTGAVALERRGICQWIIVSFVILSHLPALDKFAHNIEKPFKTKYCIQNI